MVRKFCWRYKKEIERQSQLGLQSYVIQWGDTIGNIAQSPVTQTTTEAPTTVVPTTETTTAATTEAPLTETVTTLETSQKTSPETTQAP